VSQYIYTGKHFFFVWVVFSRANKKIDKKNRHLQLYTHVCDVYSYTLLCNYNSTIHYYYYYYYYYYSTHLIICSDLTTI